MRGVDLHIRLLTRGEAERVVRGSRGRDPASDLPWAEEYPLEGDSRACVAYLSQLRRSTSHPFGYYQVVLDGTVVGGIGFHGPPVDGVVEVGYGVVPSVRDRGVATTALRQLLEVTARLDGVTRVCGRTNDDNVASQKVMTNVGMQLVGRDPDFLHFELDLSSLSPGTDVAFDHDTPRRG